MGHARITNPCSRNYSHFTDAVEVFLVLPGLGLRVRIYISRGQFPIHVGLYCIPQGLRTALSLQGVPGETPQLQLL